MKTFIDLLRFGVNAQNLAVRTEQLRTRLNLYTQMVLPQLLLALLLVWLMWDHVAHVALEIWLALVYLVHGIELYHWWRAKGQLKGEDECRHWDARFKLFTFQVACIWGAAGIVMFVPGDLAYQALLICVVMGLASAAVTSNVSHPPSMFIYLVGVMLPLLLRVIWEGDQMHLVLAGMLGLYFVYVTNAAVELIRTFELSLQRRFDNDSLVVELGHQKAIADISRLAAEQASHAKSKFLAAASHDLRQPMHALALFVEVLKSRTHDAQTSRLIEQVDDSVGVMDKMFEALLDISRLDAGVVQAHLDTFAIRPLLDRMYAEFSLLAHEKSLLVTVLCDNRAVVYSDPLLLERILRNLMSNAVRYTEHGRIEIVCTRVADGLRIEVRDTGIGIAPEDLQHVFEEYYQVENRQRDRSKGLGLGLAIVRRLEKLLGYQMTIASEQGVGSCFSFVVPLDMDRTRKVETE